MRQPPKPPQKYLAGSFLRSPIPQLPPGAKPMPSPVKHIVAPHPLQAEIDVCLQEIAEENRASVAPPPPVENRKPGRPPQGYTAKTGAQRVAESRARALHESLAVRQLQVQFEALEKFWREEHAAGNLTTEHMEQLIDEADADIEQTAYEYTLERQRERWANSQRVTHPGYGNFMADAPKGMGQIIFDSETVDGARGDEDAPDGMGRGKVRRVSPQGAGPDK
jgi:hypothetical protein